MSGAGSLYRGTTEDRFRERYGGRTAIPENWTDDPLEAFSFAMTFSLDQATKTPMVLAVPYDPDRFTRAQKSVHNEYWPAIPAHDADPTWYAWTGDQPDSRQERDAYLRRYTVDSMDDFVATELDDAAPDQRTAVETVIEDML